MPAVIEHPAGPAPARQDRRGCRIDIAMADAMFTFAWLALAQAHAGTGSRDHRIPCSQVGSPRYGLYATAVRPVSGCGGARAEILGHVLRCQSGSLKTFVTSVVTRRPTATTVRQIIASRDKHPLARNTWNRVIAAAPSCARSRRHGPTPISSNADCLPPRPRCPRLIGRSPPQRCRSARTCASRWACRGR